ncbi:MAG: aspartate aminotransferase family protein [Clostridia bacterium]|nr:aspartate aminotransferase family protein [Clostridia bacterium]
MNFEQLKSLDQQSHTPNYGRYDLGLSHGKSSTVYDVEEKQYIDFTSGIGVNSLGFADDGWAEAVYHQAKTLQHTSNLYYNEATATLTSTLTKLTGMDKVFMCNSGAEANECAIKLCRKYSFDKYGSDRYEIITLINSFHGRTMSTLTATGQDAMHPDCFAPFVGGFKYAVSGDFEDFKAKVTDKTCAVIMEMIQGEGGVLPQDKEFVKQVCEFAKQKDILVVVDEVQTGIGRTGKLLAYEHYDITPDVITLAKGLGGGLPIGACLCTEELQNVLSAGSHGSTFGGNPVACAGASYVLSKVANQEFLDEVAKKGEYIFSRLNKMKNVKSTRGLGMMIGIEVEGMTGAEVAKKCIENGLIVLTAKALVRLLPPLNITYDEIDKGLAIFENVIKGE